LSHEVEDLQLACAEWIDHELGRGGAEKMCFRASAHPLPIQPAISLYSPASSH
jgi:hypothetical protein